MNERRIKERRIGEPQILAGPNAIANPQFRRTGEDRRVTNEPTHVKGELVAIRGVYRQGVIVNVRDDGRGRLLYDVQLDPSDTFYWIARGDELEKLWPDAKT